MDSLSASADMVNAPRRAPDGGPLLEWLTDRQYDELVFVVNESLVESYTEIITRVMEESAEKFLMPYGVHAEVAPAIGDVWLKD